jgi:hypothetical protein
MHTHVTYLNCFCGNCGKEQISWGWCWPVIGISPVYTLVVWNLVKSSVIRKFWSWLLLCHLVCFSFLSWTSLKFGYFQVPTVPCNCGGQKCSMVWTWMVEIWRAEVRVSHSISHFCSWHIWCWDSSSADWSTSTFTAELSREMFTNCNMPLVSSLKTHFSWTRGFLVCGNHGVKFFALMLQDGFQCSSYAEAF